MRRRWWWILDGLSNYLMLSVFANKSFFYFSSGNCYATIDQELSCVVRVPHDHVKGYCKLLESMITNQNIDVYVTLRHE